MASKNYRIDFYQISLQPTADIPDPQAGFLAISQGERPTSHDDGEYTRELFGLVPRRNGSSIGGRLRKFRTSDLPEIGGLGEDAETIVLEHGQGLIEQNFFVWYREHNIIAWHLNGHASPVARFAAFLSEVWGTRVMIEPVLQADALQRLMSGSVEVKKFKVTIPRPTNADLFGRDDFSGRALQLMSQSGADSMHLEMGVNLTLNPHGRLDCIKNFLRDMTAAGASTARAIVDDNGITHAIDLIADRVSTTISSDSNSRFPLPDTMYQLIDGARIECQGALNDYFGTMGRVLA